MNDDVHVAHRAAQPVHVPHIPDKIPKAGVVKSRRAHFVLLQLITAKDDQLFGGVARKHGLRKLTTKGTGATDHKHD